jgi:proline iminopeptidase
VDLYVEVVGDGPPLMLMHGGLDLDHTYFGPWLDPLADHSPPIFFDHSGNGCSPRPQGFDGVRRATWADEADALRVKLGHNRIVLLGQSYGGFIAMEYALRRQDHSELVIIEERGHFPFIEEQKAFLTTVDAWLARLP